MKILLLTTLLFSIGCASRPIKCRIIALDNNYKIRKDVPPSKWHPARECLTELQLVQLLPPRHFGLEVRGGKKSRKKFFDFVMRPDPPTIPQLTTTAAMKD